MRRTLTPQALPLPCGTFVPYLRELRANGQHLAGRSLQAGQACPTLAEAINAAAHHARQLEAAACGGPASSDRP